MPDTRCPHCGTTGFVRKERVVSGVKAFVQCTCGRCNHAWIGDDRCELPDRRAVPRSDRRKRPQ